MNLASIISCIIMGIIVTFGSLYVICFIIGYEIEIIVKHIIKYKHDLESEEK